jgi:AraC family transcriptional regulator of arabinose operon
MEDASVLKVKERGPWDLKLNFCGYAKTQPLHSFGPAVRPHYLLHYVLSGEGNYYVGNKQYHVKEQQGFLIEPDVLTFYQADAENPWEYIWVGFSGSIASDIMSGMGLTSDFPVFNHENSSELKNLVDQMMECRTMSTSNELKRNGLLYLFFSILAREHVSYRLSGTNENIYISKAVEFIRNNYHTGIKVMDIANYLCINRSYLYTLFQKHLDITPQKYLHTFRLTKACELLGLTDYPIGSIALSCGYSDPMVFSRIFRQIIGKTPSDYRKEMYQQNETHDKK